MSATIDNSQTRIIDPVFDRENFRAEFRLPSDTVFQANMRLLNVGISSTVNDSYARTAGALAAIRSIQLYDGAELLDQVTDMTTFASFLNLNKTNDDNLSVRRHLDYNALGFIQQGVTSYAGPQLGLGDMTFKTQNPVPNQIVGGGASKTSWIDLRAILSFLKASMIVPTSLYRQLRLVIQFKNAEQLKNSVVADRTATLKTLTGTILVADEIAEGELKEEMKRAYQGVRYEPTEFDRVIVPAVATAATSDATRLVPVQSDFLMHGFQNKYLKKLLVVKKPTDSTTWVDGTKNTGYANMGSQACWDETLQVRVNGVNKLAGAGVVGKNRRLAMVTDCFGDIDLIPGQQLTETQGFGTYVDGGAGDGLFKTQGQVDFGAMTVEEYINTLQIFMKRSGVFANTALNQQLELILAGRVTKAAVIDGSGRGYSVVYTRS